MFDMAANSYFLMYLELSAFQKYHPIKDPGYLGTCPRGWFDAQNQGVRNDYCRWVGKCGCRNEGLQPHEGQDCSDESYWSCALAGGTTEHTSRGQYDEKPFVDNPDLGF